METMTAQTRPQTAPEGWLDLSDRALEQLQEDAYWMFCQEQDDPSRALRHVMNIVLFEQLAEVRRAVRLGLLGAAEARAAMQDDFAAGYRAGLVASYVAGCGLPPEGLHAQAALRDVLGFTFGWTQDPGPARLSGPARGCFATGVATAEEDVAAFKAWLSGTDSPVTLGLCGGLLRMRTTLH